MWSIAPISRTQVSLPKVVLLLGLTANIECSMLRHIDSWNNSQELLETAELAKWIISLEVEAKVKHLTLTEAACIALK